jgi:hypothetical protein
VILALANTATYIATTTFCYQLDNAANWGVKLEMDYAISSNARYILMPKHFSNTVVS